MKKPTVLFLCTGNSARSQMAEAWLKHLAGDKFGVFSAGLKPSVINPLTIKVMEESGISMAGSYSKPLSHFLGKIKFDFVITVCDNAAEACPIFPGSGTRLHWSFEDPAGFSGSETEKLAKFREIRDLIQQKIIAWLE